MKITVPGSGIEINIRRQPVQVMDFLKAKIAEELESEKPVPPTQQVETAPGVFREVEALHDEKYVEAMQDYERKTAGKFIERIWHNMATLAVTDEVTPEMVAPYRAYYGQFGEKLPESDREVWLRYEVAPSMDDFATLMYEIYGKSLPTDKQVAFHRLLFQGRVQEKAD